MEGMDGYPMGDASAPGSRPGANDVSMSRIEALVKLLGDENPEICTVAWTNLERIGDPVLPSVQRAVCDSADSRVRAQCERFLTEWRRRDALQEWVDFCKAGRPQLEEGVVLIARTEYPELDVHALTARLDEFASAARGRLDGVRTVDDAVQVVSSFLFQELGFRGNAEDYYHPDNSYLNRVLESRQGIPISLSALYLLVARRLSLPVFGVGLPRHFVLKYRSGRNEVFVDPFNGGRRLTARECMCFLSQALIPVIDDYLRAVTDAEILTRMLGNLLRIYLAANDQRRYDRIASMLKLLG
jgi:regulator of sirC expression with transglutaminase-like and TPR domain